MSTRGAIDDYSLVTEHSHQKYLKAISTRESVCELVFSFFFQLNTRGEGFSFDHLCDTLLSSTFRTVNLDFDFYTIPTNKFVQFRKRRWVL